MAFSATLISRNTREAIFDLTATDNADTGGAVTHGLNAVPDDFSLCPLLAAYYTSAWRVTAVTATTITVEKTAGGGADADPQARLVVRLPEGEIH